MSGNHGFFCSCKRCSKKYSQIGSTLPTERPIGKDTYGRGSRSGGYGRSSLALKAGTFDGHPSLSRRRDDGTLDIYYCPNLDMDDPLKGHAVIRNGKLISNRRPGEPRE